jgi:hypothetical protein
VLTHIQIHVVTSASPQELLEGKDAIQGTEFQLGDRVVQCPICHHWYHVDSWKYNNNKCGFIGCDGSGPIDETTPSVTPPEPEIEITIIGDIIQDFGEPDTATPPISNNYEASETNEFISIDYSELPPPMVIMPRIIPAKVGAMTKLRSAIRGGGWKLTLFIIAIIILFLIIMANQ